MSKGRKVPDQHIDHAANLRDRLGRVVYEGLPTADRPFVPWERADDATKAICRGIGQAVMDTIVVRDDRRGDFTVSSIYGAASKKPYVNVEVSVSPMQMSPAKAREIALMLLESADAAESDAVLIGYARDVLDLGDQGAAQLLNQFRQYREKQLGTKADSA